MSLVYDKNNLNCYFVGLTSQDGNKDNFDDNAQNLKDDFQKSNENFDQSIVKPMMTTSRNHNKKLEQSLPNNSGHTNVIKKSAKSNKFSKLNFKKSSKNSEGEFFSFITIYSVI